MSAEPLCASKEPVKRRLARLLIVLAGIALGQAILYGPSLAGWKILLPLDILAEPAVYLPRTPAVAKIEPQNRSRSDLIYYGEPARRFAAAELHAGRLPMWAPLNFAGAPFIWPKFSPFLGLAMLHRVARRAGLEPNCWPQSWPGWVHTFSAGACWPSAFGRRPLPRGATR